MVCALLMSGCSTIKENYNAWTNPTKITQPVVVNYTPPNATNVTVAPTYSYFIRTYNTAGYLVAIKTPSMKVLVDSGGVNEAANALTAAKDMGGVDVLVITSNSDNKLGGAKIIAMKYHPIVYETGITNANSALYSDLHQWANTTTLPTSQTLTFGNDTLELRIPYGENDGGFLPAYDDNAIVPIIRSQGKTFYVLSTCGEQCLARLNLNTSDGIVLPYKGDCSKITEASIIQLTDKGMLYKPQCANITTELTQLDYVMKDAPASIQITDTGEVVW